jgi:hypothetical protein
MNRWYSVSLGDGLTAGSPAAWSSLFGDKTS